jgi:hypothetical protein
MVFFIPWRVVAEESGAAHFGFGGAKLLDPLGPMVRPPAAPSISILVICRFGATMELGRSGRAMMLPHRFGAARATGSASPRPDRQQLALRRALSPTFPAGEMVFFIPWRVVAEESGAAH